MKYLIFIGLVIIALSNQGCLYDKPQPVTCDSPAVVTYSGYIVPILSANCYRCHSRTNAPVSGNGIILDDYASLKMQVPQPLQDAVMHTGSVVAMPKDGLILDACLIDKIKKWIAQGALYN